MRSRMEIPASISNPAYSSPRDAIETCGLLTNRDADSRDRKIKTYTYMYIHPSRKYVASSIFGFNRPADHRVVSRKRGGRGEGEDRNTPKRVMLSIRTYTCACQGAKFAVRN